MDGALLGDEEVRIILALQIETEFFKVREAQPVTAHAAEIGIAVDPVR
jgi:hypothetical protein